MTIITSEFVGLTYVTVYIGPRRCFQFVSEFSSERQHLPFLLQGDLNSPSQNQGVAHIYLHKVDPDYRPEASGFRAYFSSSVGSAIEMLAAAPPFKYERRLPGASPQGYE